MRKELGEVFKHSAIYGTGIVISRLTSFIMLPVYTHYLSPGDYGTLELLTMTLDVVATFIGLRLASGIIRFYHYYEETKDRNEVISTSLIASLLIFSFFSILFYFGSYVFSRLVFHSDSYTGLFKILFINLFFTSCIQTPLSFIQAQKRSILFVIISFSRLMIQLCLNIYFLVFLGMKVEGVLYSTLIASGAIGVYLCYITFREVGYGFNSRKFWEVAKFTAPLALSFFGMFILTYSDRYFLNYFSSLSEVGIYSLGYKFGYIVSSFVMLPVGRIWAVYQYELAKKPEAKYMFRKFFTYVNLVLIWSSLGMAIYAKDVLKVMANKSYLDAYKIVGLILVTYVIYEWFHFTHLGVLLKKKTGYVAWSTLLAALLMLILNLVLIPPFGMYGAAIGTLFAYLARFGLIYPFSQRLYRIEYDWTRILGMLLIAVVLYTVSLFLDNGSMAISITCKTCIYMLFPAIVYFSPILNQSEKIEIRRFISNPYRGLQAMGVF